MSDKQHYLVEQESGDKVKEILEKYDTESRVREYSNKAILFIITLVAVGFSLYHLYTAGFGAPPTLKHRSLHVALVLTLVFLLYPAYKRANRQKLPWYDVLLVLLSLATTVYIFVDYLGIINRGGLPNRWDVVFGTLLVILVLEGARRVTGWPLPIIASVFILYALFGRELSGIFRHRGYDWDQLVNFLYVTTEGIYGTAIGVSASYIFLFILFGAVLARSGMGQFFNDIALALAGHQTGGPAKVAVLGSAFLGSINGSAIANVVTTGAFTIPLMKKVGYHKNFAGAVEAAASVGGQILPPIMGAAAFIMAEILGLPYAQIALAALFPALLYYIGIIVQVHLRAKKDGLSGISRENLPKVAEVIKERGHLLLPLLFLIYMLFFSGKTIIFSALLTIFVTMGVAMLRKSTRMSLKDIIGALEDGARQALSVAIACAAVGVIVGVATLTGFGLKLANGIVAIGGENLMLTLILTMVACIVLGMGLPSIPTYIITVTMAAPALIQLGVEALVAHLFVFYFGLFANLTPPVALASFAATGISGGEPLRTSVLSLRLALAGFIVPYMFVFDTKLLLMDVTFIEGCIVVLTATAGVFMLGVAVEGYLFTLVHWFVRLVTLIGALLMISPDLIQSAIGLAILIIVLVVQRMKFRKEMESQPTLSA